MKTPFKRALAPEVLEAANNAAVWRAKCRRCGLKLVGLPAEILAHKCEVTDAPAPDPSPSA